MKRSDLIKQCKKYNLPYHGSKQEMVARLMSIQQKSNKSSVQRSSLKKKKGIKSKKKKERVQEEYKFVPEWIEWSDLEVLQNIVGVWVMGEKGAVAFEFMKLELKMDKDGNNRKWRGHIKKGMKNDFGGVNTNVYGEGEWRLTYPTSIYFRQNLHHICNYWYYLGYYSIDFMILSRDVINLIADFTLGIGVRSLELINMQLILSRDSFRQTEQMDGEQYTFVGHDCGGDFCEAHFEYSLVNSMVDVLMYCIEKVESDNQNNLEDYENIMRLDTFTDDEQEDENFEKYFHHISGD